MNLNIPFNEWSVCRMEHGTKTATSRYKRYGNPGDVFEVDFANKPRRFVITSVKQMTLGEVSENHYIEEGAISKEEFIHNWMQLYPSTGFVPEQVVFFHRFVQV